ncbi:nucleotide exchange factor GrpE [Streptomyces sp. NPDC003016]
MSRPTDVRGRPGASLEIVRDGGRDGPPATLSARAGDGAGSGAPRPSREEELHAELRELTADLQRLKAEYDNYRKRVRRDRLAVREIALANVLGRLLPVLDALAGAAEQGEVTGGFERVSQALQTELAALGLQRFGTVGDPFDPLVHEAVSYRCTDRAERSTCTAVLRPGYRVGDQLLRPAQVAVAGPPADP